VNVGRFFSSSLFPLLVIAAVVWLATETIRSDAGPDRRHVSYGELVQRAQERPATIRRVEFVAAPQKVRVELADGSELEATYPTDAAQLDFQKVLERERIPFDARRGTSRAWWSLLTSLLPFVLLFGFWIVLMGSVRRRSTNAETQPADDEQRRWWNG
jgi:ATP-dependent Zn protease